MSNPGYGSFGYPPPGYPGYPPPGYQPYPPPGYQGYPPPGYSGYPPPGYLPPGYGPPHQMPPAIKPGVIPLRPLTLTDILNGAFSYIRTNPKATLGLTTVVVVVAQLIGLVLQIGPLAAMGELGVLRGEEASTGALLGSSASGIASTITTLLSSIVLSGMLTVIVGRAVFGAGITVGEAWQRVRGRLLPLFGYMMLWLLAVAVPVFIVVFVVAIVVQFSGAVAFVLAIPLGLGLIALLVYLWTVLSFAPPLIVLERLGVFPSITRSFRLVKGDFWRVLGIRLLATLVAGRRRGSGVDTVQPHRPDHADGFGIQHDDPDRTRARRRRRCDRPDHHRAVQRGRGGAALHRSANPRRGVRSGAADRRGDRGTGRRADSTDHLWLTRQP